MLYSIKGFVIDDSPQQLIPTDLACITSRIVISILKLTRKHWSSLVPKKLTQPPPDSQTIGDLISPLPPFFLRIYNRVTSLWL